MVCFIFQLEMEKLTDEKQKMEERLHHMEDEQLKQQQELLEEASKKSSVSSLSFATSAVESANRIVITAQYVINLTLKL